MIRIPRVPFARSLGKLAPCLFVALCAASSAMADAVSAPGLDSRQSDGSVRGRLQPDGRVFTQAPVSRPLPSKAERVGAAASDSQNIVVPLAVEVPPAICSGHGSLNSISLTNWESGLGSWTVGTRNVADPDFDPSPYPLPGWAVVGSLPDARGGNAAFVADVDAGNCSFNDATRVLYLQSPSIPLPGGALVPRVSFVHWFNTEQGWDGGNLKLSVNGGSFHLIPTTAIEYNTYESLLLATNEGNTNPLAGQPAYTGVGDGLDGAWEEVRVNLYGLADPGDSIRIRFDFGIDGCDGVIGWYVDDVRVYSCSAELPPSDCGNGVLDAGEQCDDGNNFIGDGCSNTCQIESGWECTDPEPPGEVLDPGFEDGTPNFAWNESSTNFDTPICDEITCGLGTGSGPASGDYWAWFGGIEIYEEASLQQSILIPSSASTLTFELEASTCDSDSDYLEVRVGGVRKFLIDGSSPLCESQGYNTQTVDISQFADDKVHSVVFHAETFGENLDVTNFFVDDVAIPGAPSECTVIGSSLTLKKVVVNDHGGTALASNWTLAASGPSPFSGNGPTVFSGPNLTAGTYNLSESGGPPGYTASSWVCTGGTQNDADTITVALGQSATCTITNDDLPSSLTLKKTVINDNGGSAVPADWTLSAIGPSPISGPGPSVTSEADFKAGTYQLKETGGPSGYNASAWVCVGGNQLSPDSVTVPLDTDVTCTITNDDIDPDTVVISDGFEAQ